eukprot:Selendium_serpulae@DN1187_c0_g1_i1.p1
MTVESVSESVSQRQSLSAKSHGCTGTVLATGGGSCSTMYEDRLMLNDETKENTTHFLYMHSNTSQLHSLKCTQVQGDLLKIVLSFSQPAIPRFKKWFNAKRCHPFLSIYSIMGSIEEDLVLNQTLRQIPSFC